LATGLATYPDVTVICGPSQRDPDSPTQITNPKVVVEVSPGTADYDRAEKRQHYQQVSSIEAIVLVAHDAECIELWTRAGLDWERRVFGIGESVPLTSVACTLDVDEIYRAARAA
jgi:Uma2 family endonuclease